MSGLVAFTGPPDRELLTRMLERLRHRGRLVGTPLETPSGSAAVCEWAEACSLGVLRSGTYHIGPHAWALSGFAFSNLPDSPEPEQWAALRGSFGAACLTADRLIVGRDAVGCQSLYYGRVGNRWLVATEPKAITGEPEFRARIRPASIAQYLSFSFVPGSPTMLEDLFEVEAGHTVIFTAGRCPQPVRYFRFEEEEPPLPPSSARATSVAVAERPWIEQTRAHLRQAVAERLTPGTPTVFLSGGLDSSIVAREVASQTTGKIRTFSIHFGKQYPNELGFARAVADRIGSEHEEVLIQPRGFLPRLRQMVWHLDEPIGDPITQPNYELACHVRQHSAGVFNGEGGDPLFGGPKNLPMLLLHWYGVGNRPANFREQAYLASYRRAYEEWSRLLSEDVRRQIDGEQDLEQPLQPFFTATRPTGFLNKLMSINIRLKGANLILPKVDRMLAAHQLTPLSPLFDDRLTRLSFRMPSQMKLRTGIEKYVLKQAYASELPTEVITRPKSGMRVPVHYWFQKELRRYAHSILSKRQIRRAGIFDPERVQQLLRYDTEEGPGRYGLRLWMLLTFEIWRRMVVEREGV